MAKAILLFSCFDRKGITFRVAEFIYQHGGNIEHADQHIDREANICFMRVEWSLDGFALEKNKIAANFLPLANEFNMDWSLYFSDERMRLAVFVSRLPHCLYDILLKYKAGQFNAEIACVISNHREAQAIAEYYGIKFYHFSKDAKNKLLQEKNEIALLKQERIQLAVLARYSQIFSESFLRESPCPLVNIHHSFLPAFVGKAPYKSAFARGVKLIGATSHYVTKELDAGPIIEQDVIRVSHRDALADLVRKGEDLEKAVLSRAMRWHLEHKILSYGNKTVVFD
jgi:formyltetrahydrofolate deformylase